MNCEAQSQLCSRRDRNVEVKNVKAKGRSGTCVLLVVLGKTQRGRKWSDDIPGLLNNTAVTHAKVSIQSPSW